MNSVIPTPLTDAEALKGSRTGQRLGPYVTAEFARSLERQLAIADEALEMISKIARSSKHKDPVNDMLCEVNRQRRLRNELSHSSPVVETQTQ